MNSKHASILKNLLLALPLIFSAPSWSRVSMGGPALTYGQNVDENDQVFAGGWGLFLGSQLRFGLAAYSHLNSHNPSGASGDDFRMFYGGALLFYALNPSLTTPVEFHLGALVGAARVTIPSDSESANALVIEPTVMALMRLYPWLALGLDGRYRYTADAQVSSYSLSNLGGFSVGLTLVFGTGDGR